MEVNYHSLAADWKEAMTREVYANLPDYLQDSHFDVDALKQRTFNELLATIESEVDEDLLLENLDNLIPSSFYASLEGDAHDLKTDSELKARDPLAYHGISQRDFLPPQ